MEKFVAYDLMNGPMAVVYSVCQDEESHDFFLVPLGSVTPYVAESDSLNKTLDKNQADELKKTHEVHFNEKFGDVKKGLFRVLYQHNHIIELHEDVEKGTAEW